MCLVYSQLASRGGNGRSERFHRCRRGGPPKNSEIEKGVSSVGRTTCDVCDLRPSDRTIGALAHHEDCHYWMSNGKMVLGPGSLDTKVWQTTLKLRQQGWLHHHDRGRNSYTTRRNSLDQKMGHPSSLLRLDLITMYKRYDELLAPGEWLL